MYDFLDKKLEIEERENPKEAIYTLDKCILIRTTDIFPTNGIIVSTKNAVAYEYKISRDFLSSIMDF